MLKTKTNITQHKSPKKSYKNLVAFLYLQTKQPNQFSLKLPKNLL